MEYSPMEDFEVLHKVYCGSIIQSSLREFIVLSKENLKKKFLNTDSYFQDSKWCECPLKHEKYWCGFSLYISQKECLYVS